MYKHYTIMLRLVDDDDDTVIIINDKKFYTLSWNALDLMLHIYDNMLTIREQKLVSTYALNKLMRDIDKQMIDAMDTINVKLWIP